MDTAQQLRLAADIIETGHPWVPHLLSLDEKTPKKDILSHIASGQEIHLVLATPPDNRKLHNPSNLTAEQVGAGWRLLVVGEVMPEGYEYWLRNRWSTDGNFVGETVPDKNPEVSCRVPLSTPWPEAVDPYAELKAAHKEGKALERWTSNVNGWLPCLSPAWLGNPDQYRIKPDPVLIDLTPDDVPPGTVLRGAGEAKDYDGGWCTITSCSRTGIRIWRECDINPTETRWDTLRHAESQINRSIPLTGKWDATAWEPCHKPKP